MCDFLHLPQDIWTKVAEKNLIKQRSDRFLLGGEATLSRQICVFWKLMVVVFCTTFLDRTNITIIHVYMILYITMLLFVLNMFIDEIHTCTSPNKDLTWNLKKGRFGNRITHTPIPASFGNRNLVELRSCLVDVPRKKEFGWKGFLKIVVPQNGWWT